MLDDKSLFFFNLFSDKMYLFYMNKFFTRLKQGIVKNASLFLAVFAVVLGVFLAVRFNAKVPRVIAPASSIIALQEMQDLLEKENESLKDQLTQIESEITMLQKETKNKQADLRGLVSSVEDLKKRAGLTNISGEGVVIILNDTGERVSNPNSIAHASDMRDIVNHLFNNGAEAISIEGAGKEERVSFFTSIDCIVNTVLINGTKIVPPFKIRAIGDRQKLITAINDKTSLKQIYDRVEKEGLEFYIVDGEEQVQIVKYSGPIEIKNAKLK